jgi:hypothetical protein
VAAHDYELRFAGEASTIVRAAFPEFEMTTDCGTTMLYGRLADQAALRGTLDRIQDLGLELVEVRVVDDRPPSL